VQRSDCTPDERLQILCEDLFLHIRENRDLSGQMDRCVGRKITFELDFEARRRKGAPTVRDAELMYH
jgi:hypothetical protein